MKKDLLTRNIEEIIFKKSLEQKIKSGKKLKIKLGADPTKPDLHLGHAITLKKLKEFQGIGHEVIFLIGDYTTKIGDPTGRNSARPILTDLEIKKNSKTYFDQVGKILDIKKTKICYNSEWFSKMNFADIISLMSKATLSQVSEREDFKARTKNGEDVGFHELIYPVMQGYDSVILNSDVEIGGFDQRLNMLMGRELMKKYGQIPQDILIMPLLIGTDGTMKMSKSLGNYIGLNDTPKDQFGKTMSIPDKLIDDYLVLTTDFTDIKISELRKQLKGGRNPKEVKEIIAENIVNQYHGKNEAKVAKEEFIKQFVKKETPDDVTKIKIFGSFDPATLLVNLKAVHSKSQARRLVEQGGVKIDGAKITDPNAVIAIRKDMIIQVGKRGYWQIV